MTQCCVLGVFLCGWDRKGERSQKMFYALQFSHESQLLQVRQSAHGERGLDGLNETGWWWSGEELQVRRKRARVRARFIYSMCFVLCCVVCVCRRERERKKRPLPPPSLPPALVIPLCFGDLGNPVTKHSRGPFDWGHGWAWKFGRSEKTEEDGEQDGGGGGRGGWGSTSVLFSSSVWLDSLMSA